MSAGSLDRRIIIRRAIFIKNEFNEPVANWVNLATVAAKRRDISASESYRAQEIGAQIGTRFTIRWSSQVADIGPKDRLVFNEVEFNITGTREPEGTRNRWIEIDAVARAEGG